VRDSTSTTRRPPGINADYMCNRLVWTTAAAISFGNPGSPIERCLESGLRQSNRAHNVVPDIADCNDVNRFELFLLDEGQSKVETKEETRMLCRQDAAVA